MTIFELIVYGTVVVIGGISVFFVLKGLSFRKDFFKLSSETDSKIKPEFSENLEEEVIDYISGLLEASPDLSSSLLEPSDQLTHTASEIGLSNIEYMITGISKIYGKIPHVLGVNKAGGFLSSYFAHRLDLHEKYIIKCDYRPEHKKIRCERRPYIDGPLIVLDDVVRTGSTIIAVKKHLAKMYPEAAIFTFCLVNNTEILRNSSTASLINYSPWVSGDHQISLPWKGESRGSFKREKYFDDNEMDQIQGRLVRLDNLTSR